VYTEGGEIEPIEDRVANLEFIVGEIVRTQWKHMSDVPEAIKAWDPRRKEDPVRWGTYWTSLYNWHVDDVTSVGTLAGHVFRVTQMYSTCGAEFVELHDIGTGKKIRGVPLSYFTTDKKFKQIELP